MKSFLGSTHSNYERVLTPMEFDCTPVEMPSKIQHLSSSKRDTTYFNKTQHTVSTTQDDIGMIYLHIDFGEIFYKIIFTIILALLRSTPKHDFMYSPMSHSYHEEPKVSHCGEYKFAFKYYFLFISFVPCINIS